ncbi:iron ABC transporter permease [Bifidobacterium sp. ESL0763]|uniref:FecCD family ABC transporter permease n=1 Tax=Bifidobacterium sp. ESL0763 TaxID=2983227 RepID=UPI0023FA1A5F|nr:iron ABC transporter permease [Bifidobacterium sp. ESL0763]MDF7664492.1 iron ABC transporter permease [Bifidobacterium sp. ESL0763]
MSDHAQTSAQPAHSAAMQPADTHAHGTHRLGTPALYALLIIALLALSLLSVMFGSRIVTPADVARALTSDASDIAATAVRTRLPRTVLGILIGVALALAGALMQGVSRNPLADPSLLGLNTGAAFAIVLSIAFFDLSTPAAYVWVALLGSAVTAGLVWLIGSIGHFGATPLKLTLAGAVLSAVLSSLTSAVLLPRTQTMATYRFWQVGGISGARFGLMLPILPLLAVGAVVAFAVAPALNALALGDELAAGLGARLGLVRLVAWTGAVLLCSGATALAGPIGFVGLVIPHAARLIVGSDYRRIMPLSALLGPVLLLAADVLGRVITRPADVEVGIVTAIIGAPVFLALIRRRKVSEV